MACGVLVLVFVLGYAVGIERCSPRGARGTRVVRVDRGGERAGTCETPETDEEAYHLRMDDAYVRRWGKKYLGQGARVDNPDEW